VYQKIEGETKKAEAKMNKIIVDKMNETTSKMDAVEKAAKIVSVIDKRIEDLEKVIFKSSAETRSNYFKQVNESVEHIDK
jgi:hypothetical protein